MTDDIMDEHSLVGKSLDADFLGEMIGFVAQRLVELTVDGLTAAAVEAQPPSRLKSHLEMQFENVV